MSAVQANLLAGVALDFVTRPPLLPGPSDATDWRVHAEAPRGMLLCRPSERWPAIRRVRVRLGLAPMRTRLNWKSPACFTMQLVKISCAPRYALARAAADRGRPPPLGFCCTYRPMVTSRLSPGCKLRSVP